MVRVGLLARVRAKTGHEEEVENFLREALDLADAEPATTVWFSFRISPSEFGIFDAFSDEDGRDAHLSGQIAAGLMEKAPELLDGEPVIEKIDLLAVKLPALPVPQG